MITNAIKSTKQTKPAPSRRKTAAAPRKKLTYLKGYKELVSDPWGLES